MGYNNGSIFAPVSIHDVQQVLGSGSTDLGTLCRLANINKWARYKPVIYPGFPIRFQSQDASFNAKTGLSVGTMIDLPSTVAGYQDISITYDHPYGTLSSPYRLTDFVRYNHYAQKPCEILWRTVFKKDTGFGCTVSIYDRSSSAEETEYISFSDLMNEISGYAGFKNSDKRLCMAVYDKVVSDTDPIWYFFSEKFSTVGSSGTWSVSTNMNNTDFTSLLTIGKTYKFQVMIVSNHSYLETIPGSGDREKWEYGVSPTEMASMESGQNPIQAMCLALETGIDRTEVVLQNASVITDLSYYLDILSVIKYGSIVSQSNYQKLCTQLLLPIVTVRSRTILNNSARYQMRVQFTQGGSQYTIFRPTDRSGNSYYEIESTPSTSLAETAITPWVTVSDIGGYTQTTDGQGNTIYEYEFDFSNRTYVILSQTAPQTSGESSGLFLFFDQQGSYMDLTFKLYYKPNGTQTETLVRTQTVRYNTSANEGNVHDIEF